MIVWILFCILEQDSLPIWSCCDKSVDAFNNNGISEEYTDTDCYSFGISNDNNVIFLSAASKNNRYSSRPYNNVIFLSTASKNNRYSSRW